ncbi:MAG: 30S ribosomal protein S21 [Candidatus Dormibacteraeota bacterium]|nr:30S ribosomal protein S21 [Candidatus Dormibacteraeota bacterium]
MLDKHRQAGSRMVLDGPEELELALRLFRDDTLMAKREARRKQYFVAPSARRKIKSIAARRRASRARRKRSVILLGEGPRRGVRR